MESPGKVLIVVQNLPVPFDRRVWLEATTLRSAGFQVAVISPKGKAGDFQLAYEQIDEVDVYRYPAPPEAYGVIGYLYEFSYSLIMTAGLTLKLWRSRGIDIFQACNPPDTFFVLALILKATGVSFVFDHHDLSPEMYLAKGGRAGGLLHRGLQWLEKMTFRTADVVIATNESHREVAMTRGRVPSDKVFVVRSGPDLDRLQVTEPNSNLRNGFEYLACYLGEMNPQDGVDYLLRAIKVFADELSRRDTKFVLMGGGPSIGSLKRMSHDLGLEDYVEFTGRVTDEELCSYLSTADVCLDPDPYSEWADKSTMNKVIEYMAFGKPIVAFDLTETRWSAAEAALYVKPNDVRDFALKIEYLLANPSESKWRGEVGRERVENQLAWSFSVEHLLAAYQVARSR